MSSSCFSVLRFIIKMLQCFSLFLDIANGGSDAFKVGQQHFIGFDLCRQSCSSEFIQIKYWFTTPQSVKQNNSFEWSWSSSFKIIITIIENNTTTIHHRSSRYIRIKTSSTALGWAIFCHWIRPENDSIQTQFKTKSKIFIQKIFIQLSKENSIELFIQKNLRKIIQN